MKTHHKLAATTLLLLCVGIAYSNESSEVVEVQEFWTLEVGQPDPAAVAPQVTTSMTAKQYCEHGLYAAFCLNHQLDGDDFVGGGLQLQLWHGEDLLATKSAGYGKLLSTNGERISWTQKMSIKDGVLTFCIHNGQSQTWESFGECLNMRLSTQLENLNAYRYLDSIENSGPVFAGNHVAGLALTKIKVTYASGEVVEVDLSGGN